MLRQSVERILAVNALASGSKSKGRPIEDDPQLPKQLSPAILAMLLEDLLEYNGLRYRRVPLHAFRGKYVGLYFSAMDKGKCMFFLEKLKGFYVVMSHRLELVLASFDSSPEAYELHTQMSSWPAYPQGDFRVSMLTSHFGVEELPRLVVLDPNGIVVSSDAVRKIECDLMGFPWVDPSVEALWGLWGQDGCQKTNGELLAKCLAELQLPTSSDGDDEVLGILLGELWCPDTRAIAERAHFLLQRLELRRRTMAAGVRRPQHVAIYLVHEQELGVYKDFPGNEVPFPTVWLQDAAQRRELLYLLGTEHLPTLCFTSRRSSGANWVVTDGANWLERDPTGVCFPWCSQDDATEGLAGANEDGWCISDVQELDEESVGEIMTQGPVFLALLQDLHYCRRSEAMTMLCNLARGYKKRLAMVSETRIVPERFETGTMASSFDGGSPTDEEAAESMWGTRQNLESQDTNDEGQQIPFQPALLEPSRYGTAPWNLTDRDRSAVDAARSAGLRFRYSASKGAAERVLSRFCCCDAEKLQAHELWSCIRARQAADRQQLYADLHETRQKLSRLVPSQTGSLEHGFDRGSGSDGVDVHVADPADETAGVQDAEDHRAVKLRNEETPRTSEVITAAAAFVEPESLKSIPLRSPYLPRTEHMPYTDLTQELLGESGDPSNGCGSAMIIDLALGKYYVCGTLTDQATVTRFIESWLRGELTPLEMRLQNDDEVEVVQRKENAAEVAQQPQLNERSMTLPLELPQNLMPTVMPGIVIWLPTAEHARSQMAPASLFRALLQFAYCRCPIGGDRLAWTGGNSISSDMGGIESGDQVEQQALQPWIERFWIFCLRDGEQAAAEKDSRDWAPPGNRLLDGLRDVAVKCKWKAESAQQEQDPKHQNTILPVGSWRASVALREMRRCSGHEGDFVDGSRFCLRTGATRQELHAMMLDELAYHCLVDRPAPPLFIVLVGDLPPADKAPWPSSLSEAYIQVVGSAPDLTKYRRTTPRMTVMRWEEWLQTSCDDRIAPSAARSIGVPWF